MRSACVKRSSVVKLLLALSMNDFFRRSKYHRRSIDLGITIVSYFICFTLIYCHASRIVAKYSRQNNETMTYVLKCQDLVLCECQLMFHAASLLLSIDSIGFCLFCAKINKKHTHTSFYATPFFFYLQSPIVDEKDKNKLCGII